MLSNHLRRSYIGGFHACRMTMMTDERQKRLYPQVEQERSSDGYPILKLKPSKRIVFNERVRTTRRRERNLIMREESMKEDQDWPSIWPTAKTFVPSAVPLPLRQSFETKNIPLGKHANRELLKIANFLHLTPVAIQRHCEALKKFCTKWPDNLDTDEEVRSHFPVTLITSDYLHSAPTIRDPRARIVYLKIKISDLKLNSIDEDKIIRLARHRYNNETGEITIEASACPTKVQNQDYAEYLLTALYFESKNHEKWEESKEEEDWERFYWDKSQSKHKIEEYIKNSLLKIKEQNLDKPTGVIDKYKTALEKVYEKESFDNLECYRSSVESLLGFDNKQLNKDK